MASQNAHDEHAISEPLSPRVLLSASTSRPLQGQVPARRRELRTRPLELDPSPGFQTPVHASAVRPHPRSDPTATGRSPGSTTSSPRPQLPYCYHSLYKRRTPSSSASPPRSRDPCPRRARRFCRIRGRFVLGVEKFFDPVRRFEHLAGNWRWILRGSPSEPVSWIFCLEERGGRWVRCGG